MSVIESSLEKYSAASKASAGKIFASYGISNGEIFFFEAFDSTNAMDIHIGNCFPHYILMASHASMEEAIVTCDASDIEWWKMSVSGWGPKKLVVTPAM